MTTGFTPFRYGCRLQPNQIQTDLTAHLLQQQLSSFVFFWIIPSSSGLLYLFKVVFLKILLQYLLQSPPLVSPSSRSSTDQPTHAFYHTYLYHSCDPVRARLLLFFGNLYNSDLSGVRSPVILSSPPAQSRL